MNMKKLHNKISLYSVFCQRSGLSVITISLLSAIAVLFTSCENYFNTPSQSQLSTDNFYQTPAQIDQALVGVYGTLKPFAKYYYVMSEYRSDNMFITTEAKQRDEADCAQFNSTGLLTDAIVASCWADHYTLIAAANTLLDRMEANQVEFAKPTMRTQYEAEARFLRALSYFDLVRFYGRVPLTLHEMNNDEAFALKQSETAEVYAAIVADLQFAADNLADKATDYRGNTHAERASRLAAVALLGKVYMQMAGYPLYSDTKKQAEQCFKQVLDNGAAYWIDDAKWDHLWIHENDNKYFIFEIQYVAAKDQGNPAAPLARTSNYQADEYCGPNLTNGPHAYVSRLLLDHFLQKRAIDDTTFVYADNRLTWTIHTGAIYDEETGGIITDITDGNKPMYKFFEHKIKRAALGYPDMDAEVVNYTYWPLNFPVLRIEDIALLYCECVGPTAEGMDLLNRIHTRAGLTPYGALGSDQFQQAVIKERQYELLGEGHRWFDEVRQNTFVADLQKMFFDYRDNRDNSHSNNYTIYANRVTQNSALYPIPLSQIQVRDGLYQQNPGY